MALNMIKWKCGTPSVQRDLSSLQNSNKEDQAHKNGRNNLDKPWKELRQYREIWWTGDSSHKKNNIWMSQPSHYSNLHIGSKTSVRTILNNISETRNLSYDH